MKSIGKKAKISKMIKYIQIQLFITCDGREEDAVF